MKITDSCPNKTVIITGANTGLGYECAKSVAKSCLDRHIVIAGRNMERVSRASGQIKKETGMESVSAMLLDLASISSIRKFVSNYLNAGLPLLDCLICNAGVHPGRTIHITRDGYEAAFGVNYLGHFLLTNLLLPNMTDCARIIMVSSRTHDYRDVSPFPKPVYKAPAILAKPLPPRGETVQAFAGRAYSNSKLCLTMFAFELERRLRDTGKKISVNVFDPGGMVTDLTRDYNPAVKVMMRGVWPAVRLLPNMSTSKNSAAFMAELAVSDKFKGISGKYFSMIGSYKKGAMEAEPSPLVFDREKTNELWAGSEELVAQPKD
jgi:NAD(P)-dependent dehydrogenase (short-subunit alcohol dehydrogenase family)